MFPLLKAFTFLQPNWQIRPRFSSKRNAVRTHWDRASCQKHDFFQFNPKSICFLQNRSKPQHSGFKSRTYSFQAFGGCLSPKLYFLNLFWDYGWVMKLWHMIAATHFLKHFQEWNKTNKAKKRGVVFFFRDLRKIKHNSGGVLAFDTGDQCEMLKLVFHFFAFSFLAGLVLRDWLQFYFSNIVVQVEEGELFKTGALSFLGCFGRKIHYWPWLW